MGGDYLRETLADYCRRTERKEILAQWDAEKNLPLTPETVSYGSKRRIWWQCEKGHTWQTTLCTRISGGAGCPVASRFERESASGDGHIGSTPEGMVDLPSGPCVESRHLFPHWNQQMRLSYLFRACQSEAAGAVSSHAGPVQGRCTHAITDKSRYLEQSKPLHRRCPDCRTITGTGIISALYPKVP